MRYIQVSDARVSFAVDETDVSKAFDIALKVANEYLVTVQVNKEGPPTVSIDRRRSHK